MGGRAGRPRARIRKRRGSAVAVERTFYRLADEPREVILVACNKCEWKAAFLCAELIAEHGAACPMPSLLEHLAVPGCAKVGSQWDRCGVHYVEPIAVACTTSSLSEDRLVRSFGARLLERKRGVSRQFKLLHWSIGLSSRVAVMLCPT